MGKQDTHDDFYRKLRQRVKDWAVKPGQGEGKWMEYVLAAPDLFHLLVKLTLDKDVPFQRKVQLGIVIAYFVSPIDLIPDFIPVAGILDDISLAAWVLNGMLRDIDPEVIRRNWAGDGDVLELIQKVVSKADEMLGSGLWKKIKKLVGSGNSGKGSGSKRAGSNNQ
jgi:uncharacterized membrane protein YkvA (DUF1232 family)